MHKRRFTPESGHRLRRDFHNAAFLTADVVGCNPQTKGEHMRPSKFITLVVGAAVAWPFAAIAQPEMPADSIAAQVRQQGHRCDEPLSATRDTALSKPNEAVWVLKCANSTYRVQLMPNMAARVERLE